jgi:hypothetical protein
MAFLMVFSGALFCRSADVEVDSNTAKSTWIEMGFFSPIQICDEKTDVKCFRLSLIYTKNRTVNGLDVGIVCESDESNGLQFAWTNNCLGGVTGLSAGVFNFAEYEMNGMQVAVYNRAGSDSEDKTTNKTASCSGYQWGWVNCADAVFTGFQLGITNVSTTLLKGLQIGVVNIAQRPEATFEEFQTEEFKKNKDSSICFQIGLINFNPKGFLPVTLLVNF